MTRVLFVCLGNICRSPMAESLLRHKLGDRTDVLVDSAGTGDWHAGQFPDVRTRRTLEDHGILQWSRARQITSEDFVDFDHIIAMDANNVRDIRAWRGAVAAKVSLATSWLEPAEDGPVPDPYYDGLPEFELVYQQLDRITDGILARIG